MFDKLGELLVKNQTITPEQLSSALKEQEESGRMMGSILVEMGALKDSDLLQFLSEQHGVPSIKLSEFQIDPEVLKIIPAGVASKYQVMPISDAMKRLIIEGANAVQLADQASAEGIWDIRRSGMQKAADSVTSLAEVNRVTVE